MAAEFILLDMTATALCDELKNQRPLFPFIVIVGPAEIPRAIAVGDVNIVVKPVKLNTMLDAIKHVTSGGAFAKEEFVKAFGRMTLRELEVVPLIAAGLSSRQIAEWFDIAVKTIEAQRARIMDKTRAVDVGHLARMWRAWNQQ